MRIHMIVSICWQLSHSKTKGAAVHVPCLGMTLFWNGNQYWQFGGLCCHFFLSTQQMKQQSLPFWHGAVPGPRAFFLLHCMTSMRSLWVRTESDSKFLHSLLLLHRNCRVCTKKFSSSCSATLGWWLDKQNQKFWLVTMCVEMNSWWSCCIIVTLWWQCWSGISGGGKLFVVSKLHAVSVFASWTIHHLWALAVLKVRTSSILVRMFGNIV
jgi:hypothetical protein